MKMKMNVVVGSIFAAALLLVVSFISVVGYQSVQATDHEGSSPLFAVRTEQALEKTRSDGVSAFLGKGTSINLFPTQAGSQQMLIQTAIQIFRAHPALLAKLIQNLDKYPYIAGLLTKQGIKTEDISTYMKMIQNNPSFVTEEILDQCLVALEKDPRQPLGLSTSSALGCFIVAMMALLPLTIVLTLLLLFFTVRILTCMNFNDCANNLAQKIWDQMIQGLTQG
jgi:hypothetical protein